MIVLNAMRDFADGLSRGLMLFVTERRNDTETVLLPPTGKRRR